MTPRDLASLILLAALWGGSFLFMRVAAPAFGSAPMAFVRVGGAALVLLPWLWWTGQANGLRTHWKPLLLLGLTNSALPFVCFGYAAHTLPVGLAAIFNAATPMATAALAWWWLGDPLTRWRIAGLLIGFGGVAGLALVKSLRAPAVQTLQTAQAVQSVASAQSVQSMQWQFDWTTATAIGACLLATLMYGYSACLVRRHLKGVPSAGMAFSSQASAAAALLLPAAWQWPAQAPSPVAWAAVIGLAVLCSGVAYLLYFRLLLRVGPTPSSTVTFLVPVFASLWGFLLLGEPVTWPMLIGGAAILAGTAMVLGLWPRPVKSGPGSAA